MKITTTSGTTIQCFRAYSATLPKGTKDALRHRQDLTEFLGVSVGSVERIINERVGLQGLTLIKMQRFLELKGFKVQELEKMPKLIRTFGDLIAFGIVRVETLIKDLDYHHSNGVYRLAFGETDHLPSHRKALVKTVCETFDNLLTSEKKRWQSTVKPIVVNENGAHAPFSPSKTAVREFGDDEIIVAGLIKAAEEPLKRLIASAKVPADRKRIREAIGGNTLLSVSTDLNRFCSETAFAQYLRFEAPSSNHH